MKFKIATGLIALLMFASAVPLAKADDKDAKTVRTLTGCLQKGDGANEFVLTANDGSRWELRSESVKMAPQSVIPLPSPELQGVLMPKPTK